MPHLRRWHLSGDATSQEVAPLRRCCRGGLPRWTSSSSFTVCAPICSSICSFASPLASLELCASRNPPTDWQSCHAASMRGGIQYAYCMPPRMRWALNSCGSRILHAFRRPSLVHLQTPHLHGSHLLFRCTIAGRYAGDLDRRVSREQWCDRLVWRGDRSRMQRAQALLCGPRAPCGPRANSAAACDLQWPALSSARFYMSSSFPSRVPAPVHECLIG